MPRAPKSPAPRARSARQASNPLGRAPNYKEAGTSEQDDYEEVEEEDNPIEGSSGGAGPGPSKGKGKAVGVTSSYNPLGNLGESDDDQEGNPDELAAILKHFNRRTTKAEKEEQKKLTTQWDRNYKAGIQANQDLVQATNGRVEARIAAEADRRKEDHNPTERCDQVLAQLDDQVEHLIAQLDKSATQLSPRKNSELRIINQTLSRREERVELAKQDFDASLEKHATEEIEMARLYAQSGPQMMHAFKKLLLA